MTMKCLVAWIVLAMAASRALAAAPTLGKLEINVKYKRDDGAVRPIGPVGLRLTCTNPVAFTHQVTTSASGHLELRAPCGSCRVESAYPVRVEGKRYAWKSDVEISPEKTTVDLVGEIASVQGAADVPLPTAAGERVEPVLPTGDVVLPVLLVGVEPEYPDVEGKPQIDGKVIMQAVIGVDGRVSEVTVLSTSSPRFNSAAIQAASERFYLPCHQNGKPIPIYFTLRTDFRQR